MHLRDSALAAGRWTVSSQLIRALLQLVQTMVLARMLVPGDFGLMAIVVAVYSIIALFADMGVSSALMHMSVPSRKALSTLFWVSIGVALLLMLLCMLLAWPMARIYDQPELIYLLPAMSVALPLGALGLQFRVLAEKRLEFKRVVCIEMAASVAGCASALLVAWVGGGPYALVASAVVASGIGGILALVLLSDGWRPGLCFDLRLVRDHLRYGSYRLGDSLVTSLQLQADTLIGGTFAGPVAMGNYSLPRDLAVRISNTLINPVVTRVSLPVMALVQHDRGALKKIYLKTLNITASLNFPVYVTLWVWAQDFAYVLLGSQWNEAGRFLQLFAAWGLLRSIGNPVGSLLVSTGQIRRGFFWNIAQLALVLIVYSGGAMLAGLDGVSWALVVLQLAILYPFYYFLVLPVCGASFVDYIKQLAPPLAAAVVAAALGYIICSYVATNPVERLVVGALVTGVAYVLVSLVVNPDWLTTVAQVTKPSSLKLKKREANA